jgi:hypothetical protein
MPRTVKRRNAIETLTTAAGWLPTVPALVGLFLVVGLLNAAGQFTILLALVSSLVSVVVSAVAYLTAADLVEGRSPAIDDHVGTAVRRTPALVGISIVTFVGTAIGFVFLVIPGIYIALRLELAAVACVVDDQDLGESLSTSWEVAEGNLLKLFGIQLATGLVSLVVVAVLLFALASPAALLQNDGAALFRVYLGVAPVTAILGPITEMAVGRIYLENRHEGGDESLTAQPGDDAWAATESESRAAETTDWSADADDTDDDPSGSWPGEDRQ